MRIVGIIVLLRGMQTKISRDQFRRYQRYFFPGRFDEKSNAIKPSPAKCIPELQPVSLKLDDDPSIMIFPSCTRIKRCGGCCSSSLLLCQPTSTETINFEVIDRRQIEEYKREHAHYHEQPTRQEAVQLIECHSLVLS